MKSKRKRQETVSLYDENFTSNSVGNPKKDTSWKSPV
jgi:hypothetical protein